MTTTFRVGETIELSSGYCTDNYEVGIYEVIREFEDRWAMTEFLATHSDHDVWSGFFGIGNFLCEAGYLKKIVGRHEWHWQGHTQLRLCDGSRYSRYE